LIIAKLILYKVAFTIEGISVIEFLNRAKILFVVLSLFLFTILSFSQDNKNPGVYNPPKFIFELAGSWEVPIGSAYGYETQDFFSFKDYGLVHGIGFHFDAKYGIGRRPSFYPYISVAYRQIQNDDLDFAYIDSNSLRSGYPLSGSTLLDNRFPGISFLAIRDFSLGIGLQYMLATRKRIIPFFGFEFDYHKIWGLYYQIPNPPDVVGPNPTGETIFKINPATRFGLGFDAGFDYRIATNIGFVFGVKYKIANLIGKESSATQPASQNPGDLNTMNLLDAAAPNLNSNLTTDRSLTYFEFYLGFSVFLAPKK